MKLKTWHLFLFITILFLGSYYVINLKFDKFYRVNGINNDNRVLIETYLDDDEQKYLVENQISIDKFIKFIKFQDFHLKNYQYYNLLDQYTHYSNKQIISNGNSLASRLEFLYQKNAYNYAETLVKNSLQEAFLQKENFNFKYVNLYINLKTLYKSNDYSYIDDCDTYIEKLKLYGITSTQDLEDTFSKLCEGYNQDSLKSLLKKDYDKNVSIVYDPYEFTTIVDKEHYIGEYSPKELTLTSDIPRVKYSMYLQKDAYSALMKMYQDLSENYGQFLLVDAYDSYDTIKKENNTAGYNEEQLGLTIRVSQSEISYSQFQETDLSQWLEDHAYEYGYILRYPSHKASITNHNYDAHIYRYVGKSLAKTLYESNMTLEEYIQSNTKK